MMSSPQFVIKKNLGSDQQRQPNIFVLQALLEKLHRRGRGGGQIGSSRCKIG